SYYQSNMAFLDDRPPLDLNDPGWVIHTQSADRPPVRFEPEGRAERSLIANGCRIAGQVVRSILFPGVTVAAEARVSDSIVMNDTTVSRRAEIDHAIVDKEVLVGEASIVGWGESDTPNRACPEHLSSGLSLVGKGAQIPGAARIGRNARIGAY